MTVTELIKTLQEYEKNGLGEYEVMIEDRINLASPTSIESFKTVEALKRINLQSLAIESGSMTLEEELKERFMNQ